MMKKPTEEQIRALAQALAKGSAGRLAEAGRWGAEGPEAGPWPTNLRAENDCDGMAKGAIIRRARRRARTYPTS